MAQSLTLVLLFNAASICLFGFIACKPEVLVAMTPIKSVSDAKLAKIYRWIAIVVLCGIPIDLLLRFVFHY
jgi:hypothetical protein